MIYSLDLVFPFLRYHAFVDMDSMLAQTIKKQNIDIDVVIVGTTQALMPISGLFYERSKHVDLIRLFGQGGRILLGIGPILRASKIVFHVIGSERAPNRQKAHIAATCRLSVEHQAIWASAAAAMRSLLPTDIEYLWHDTRGEP